MEASALVSQDMVDGDDEDDEDSASLAGVERSGSLPQQVNKALNPFFLSFSSFPFAFSPPPSSPVAVC